MILGVFINLLVHWISV